MKKLKKNYKSFLINLLVIFLLIFTSTAKAEKEWVLASSSNHWQARSMFGATLFTNNVWLTGGSSNFDGVNDEWKSENGVDWTLVTDDAPWGYRFAHQTVVFKDELWLYGGKTGEWVQLPQKDIWKSQNGVDWIWLNNNAPWLRRDNHGCIVYSNKVWILGGGCATNDLDASTIITNDVWSSTDGLNWKSETSAAQWAPRTEFSALTFNGKMWVIGGFIHFYEKPDVRFSDVWSSSDGTNWTLVTDNAPWGKRSSGEVVVYENKMFLLGGYTDSESWKNDVWTSQDGSNWTLETAAAPWHPRAGHRCLVKDDTIWLMGGYNNGNYGNGVWIYGDKPNINVSGNGNIITNGSQNPNLTDGTFFGSAMTYGHSVTQTFLIEATGKIPLSSDISISNSSAFSILSGKNLVTAPNSSSIFSIVFSPETAGTTTGTVHVLNNSSNSPNFSFLISGEGILSPPPIIKITGNDDFGEVDISDDAVTNFFTIENSGGDLLEINNFFISNSTAFSFIDTTIFPVPPDTSTVFEIAFNPENVGFSTGIVYILNNSTNAANYFFSVIGEGVPEPAFIWIIGLLLIKLCSTARKL